MKLDITNKKTFILIGSFLVVIVVLASLALLQLQPQQQDTENPTIVKVGYLPVLNSLPLFVAVEQGMFEKEGMKVELFRFESPPQIIDALITGRIDAAAPSAASGIITLSDIKNPDSIKVFAFSCSTKDALSDELLVSKNSHINSINDLKGKKLGIIPGIQFMTVAKKILIKNGLQPSDVTLVEIPVPNQLAALQAGGVDALLTLEPTSTIGEQKNISKVLVANPMVKYVSDPWCGGAGAISTSFLKSKPNEARAFVKIIHEAVDETETNADSREYLVKYLSLPETIAQKVPFPDWVGKNYLDPKIAESYQEFADVFFELNVTQSKPDVSGLFLQQ